MRDLECTKLMMEFTSMCAVFVSDRAGIWPMWNRSVILRQNSKAVTPNRTLVYHLDRETITLSV